MTPLKSSGVRLWTGLGSLARGYDVFAPRDPEPKFLDEACPEPGPDLQSEELGIFGGPRNACSRRAAHPGRPSRFLATEVDFATELTRRRQACPR